MQSAPADRFSWRISAATLGAIAGGLLASLLIAGISAVQGQVPATSGLGLLAPVALVVSALAALWALMLHGVSKITALDDFLCCKNRRLGLLLSAPAVVCSWWLVGHLSLELLVAFEARPRVGGALVATSTLGCFVGTAWLVGQGADRLSRWVSPPSVRVTVAIALGLPALLAAALIVLGKTSGVGSPFALFGVFKRDELDLSPVGQLLAIALPAYWGAVIGLGSQRRRLQAGVAALLVALASWSLWNASRIEFRSAVAVERASGLFPVSLAVLQGLSDSDGDGVARHFGGGDCDDSRREIRPGAKDIPNNGVDEDCSGADLSIDSSVESAPEKSVTEPELALPENANFLLLTIDTLRFDLGYTGHHENSNLSPQLDAFAKRSTVFENAYSLASYTSKSLGPMMIGRYPSETARTFEHFDRFPKTIPFVQERLQEAEVATVSVQGYWYFFFKGYGFERGWDVLDSEAAPRVVAIEGDRTSNGDELADQSIAQLTKLAQSDKRFFMWTHWVDPHAEYVAHEQHDYGSGSRERYDGEVSFVDAQVGRVLEALDKLSLAESTVVLITSDHGEAFGEHGMIRHGFEVWEELVRVPLILHVPGAPSRKIAARRSLIDVPATLAEVFGLETEEKEWFRGTSLLQDALIAADVAPAVRPILVDMPAGPHNKQRRAFYSGAYKLITSQGRVIGLFDLKEDPGEKNDLADDEALVTRLKDEMSRYLLGLEEIPATR